jgi:hypothetical protein
MANQSISFAKFAVNTPLCLKHLMDVWLKENIMKLSDKEASAIHHVLIFGPPKSGKTQLVGTLAASMNLIWFDLENGYETLLKLPREQKDRVEIIQIPDTRSFPIAIETMLKVIKGGKFSICETHGKVSCAICKKENKPFSEISLVDLPRNTALVVDSITQLTNSGIAHITRNQPDDYKLTYDDWGNLGKIMDMFLSHVQNAPFNVICISHETEVEMEDGKQKLVPTAGTRNFSRNSARYFGEVVYCEVKNKKHIAASSTTYANNILTGSRSGIALESSPEATLLSIFTGNSNSSGNTNEKASPPPASSALEALRRLNAGVK